MRIPPHETPEAGYHLPYKGSPWMTGNEATIAPLHDAEARS